MILSAGLTALVNFPALCNILLSPCDCLAQAWLGNNTGQPLPTVRLTLRPPQLLFALGTTGCGKHAEAALLRGLNPATGCMGLHHQRCTSFHDPSISWMASVQRRIATALHNPCAKTGD